MRQGTERQVHASTRGLTHLAIILVAGASPAVATSLLSPTGHFLNDPGQPYPSDPRLAFDSRLMFRNTINGGAIAIGSEWVLHAYHAQFPAFGGGVDGYVGRTMDQFASDGSYLNSYRVIASREDFALDYAVFRVERIDGSPANLPSWVDVRELYPSTSDVAVWGSFGPQSVTLGPMGEPIQTPPHPRGVKWGTIGADRASFPGLPSDVQEVPGDSGSGIFVRDGFNLRLASILGAPLTASVRQQIESWVNQMGGSLARYPLQVGTFTTSNGAAGGDWFDPMAWSSGVPGASDDAWIDQNATASLSSPGAVARNLYIGVGQHNLSGLGTLGIGAGGELAVGRLMLGVTEGDTTPAVGVVDQSGGSVQSESGVIGYRGIGSYTLTGGTLAVAEDLVVARDIGSSGTLAIGGAGAPFLSAGMLVVGREGGAVVEQSSGQVNISGEMVLGRFEQGGGEYRLSGGSLDVGSNLILGQRTGTTGTLSVSDGNFTTTQLILSRGRVEMSGGIGTITHAASLPGTLLRLTGGTLTLIEGGSLAGTIDFAGGTAAVSAGGLTDLSTATLSGSGSTSLHVRPGGLVVLPAGVSAGSFGAVSSDGAIVHTFGGTIQVGAGTHLHLYGTIRDYLRVEGSLIATPGVRGSDIDLLRGFDVAGGVLQLGSGANAMLSVSSRNDGGMVSGGSMRLAGGVAFTQTAGTSEFASIVRITPLGSLLLSGGELSSGSLELRGTLTVSGGTLRVTGPTELTGRLIQSGGEATLGAVMAANPPASAGATVSGGTLSVDSVRTASLDIGAGGVVRLDPQDVSDTTSVLWTLSIVGGASPVGTLDIGRERLVVDYSGFSPLDDLRDALASGYASGAWTGPGITSSAAAADPARFAVGLAEAASLGVTQFGDYDLVDPTEPNAPVSAVLMRWTVAGDANLDGSVGLADFARLAGNFNLPGHWSEGDFNFDGMTGVADFSILASNFNQSLPGSSARVPEPTFISFVMGPLSCWVLRRKRTSPTAR